MSKERISGISAQNKDVDARLLESASRSAPSLSADASQAFQSGAPYVHHLQRTVGNRAVHRLIQTKMGVSQPGDAHEQEADEVARQVVNMPLPVSESSAQRQATPRAGDANPLQIRTLTESVARNEDLSGETVDAGEGIEQQLDQSIGKGSPLPEHVRSFMEPRFGADFSAVRVHTGNDALQTSEALSAQAFAVGPDIYYGAGKSPSDLELTAHELTHVVQQGGTAQAQDIKPHDGAEGRVGQNHGPAHDAAPTRTAPAPLSQGLSRRMIHRRGVTIPQGVTMVPAPTNNVDGSRVVTKLNEMGAGMWSGFEGFNGSAVERQIVNALDSSNLQPRSIAINWTDTRGINKTWTGTVNIRMENSTPVAGPGGSGIGTVTGGGGGTGTSGTATSTSSTTGASGGASGEYGGGEGSAGKVGGNASGQASTTTTEGESQGSSGSATTGASTVDRIQRYQCTIVADIFLKCELDFSGSDYVNPFKWGAAGADAIMGANQRTDSVVCGPWTYQASTGIAPATPPTLPGP